MLITLAQILDEAALSQAKQILKTNPWCDGRATAGTLARFAKQNLQLDDTSEAARDLSRRFVQRLGSQPAFIAAALPHKIYPPRFNCYQNGGYYDTHVDSAVMPLPNGDTLRSDLSATLFLSDPDSYDGGELEIETEFGVQTVKLAAGDLVLYPSTSLHRVTPVTRGARYAAFFWVQSLVRSHEDRSTLYDLDQSIQQLTRQLGASHAEVVQLSGVYHNLLRRWAEC